MSTTTIAKWGNSYAVRIPKAVLELGQFQEGESLEINLSDTGNLTLRRVRRRPSLEELVSGIAPENTPAETTWGTPVGREAW